MTAVMRERMVREQLERRGLTDARVLEVMGRVERERFVPPSLRPRAYEDGPLSIEHGQTISQPYIVALMAEAAQLRSDDRLLEIGTGSGYATAVYAELVAEVFTMERVGTLLDGARARLDSPRYSHVHFALGDGTLGWRNASPFDAIIVAASSEHAPPSLLDQLRLGGRLVIPLGPTPEQQELVCMTKSSFGNYERKSYGGVRFVPLVGADGWAA